MVTSSLLIFASACVQIKMPKEGREHNQTIQLINGIWFLNRFCYFEINFMMKTLIYPNIFHCALHISRMIDKPIEETLTNCYNAASRHLTKSIAALEIVTENRLLDVAYIQKLEYGSDDDEVKPKVENKAIEEGEKKEEEILAKEETPKEEETAKPEEGNTPAPEEVTVGEKEETPKTDVVEPEPESQLAPN